VKFITGKPFDSRLEETVAAYGEMVYEKFRKTRMGTPEPLSA